MCIRDRDLIDAETDHQIGNHLRLLVGGTDDPDGLIDIQQDFGKPLQQMQLVLGAAPVSYTQLGYIPPVPLLYLLRSPPYRIV